MFKTIDVNCVEIVFDKDNDITITKEKVAGHSVFTVDVFINNQFNSQLSDVKDNINDVTEYLSELGKDEFDKCFIIPECVVKEVENHFLKRKLPKYPGGMSQYAYDQDKKYYGDEGIDWEKMTGSILFPGKKGGQK